MKVTLFKTCSKQYIIFVTFHTATLAQVHFHSVTQSFLHFFQIIFSASIKGRPSDGGGVKGAALSTEKQDINLEETIL